MLGLGKEEREKQNGLKANVITIGPFCFGDRSRHLVGVITFRIDSRTIKRDETRQEIWLSKCH